MTVEFIHPLIMQTKIERVTMIYNPNTGDYLSDFAVHKLSPKWHDMNWSGEVDWTETLDISPLAMKLDSVVQAAWTVGGTLTQLDDLFESIMRFEFPEIAAYDVGYQPDGVLTARVGTKANN